MVMLIGPSAFAFLPLPFVGGGLLSHNHLQYASTAHAQRLLEHRRGCERYDDAVAYTAWKLQKRIKKDVGYRLWAAYNDCTALYFAYWKMCYMLATLQRVMESLPGGSA